jgi:hypothetical protein
MITHWIAQAAFVAVAVTLTPCVSAQSNAQAELEKYRQMLQEGNPAEVRFRAGSWGCQGRVCQDATVFQ